MKTYSRRTSFRKNQSGVSHDGPSHPKPCQPPRKRVTQRPESVIRLTYSDIVKRPKRIPPYSVWYPATSSCSASGRSNGARAVSAVPASMKTTKPTNCGTTYGRYHHSWYWRSTMSTSDNERDMSTTPSTESASDTSYETSCAQ